MTQTSPGPNGRRAGDVIGNAARSPLHVRFELWKWTGDRGFVAVDPAGPKCCHMFTAVELDRFVAARGARYARRLLGKLT